MANYLIPHQKSPNMNEVFGALADPTRRDILERLTQKDLIISEIAECYKFTLPTISRHLSVLERAQLITKRKIGREYRVSFEPQTMKTVSEYVSFYSKFWTKQLSNLEKFLQGKK